jgi:hypothetical protein
MTQAPAFAQLQSSPATVGFGLAGRVTKAYFFFSENK